MFTKKRVGYVMWAGLMLGLLSRGSWANDKNFKAAADQSGCASLITKDGIEECKKVQGAKNTACNRSCRVGLVLSGDAGLVAVAHSIQCATTNGHAQLPGACSGPSFQPSPPSHSRSVPSVATETTSRRCRSHRR